MSVSDTYAHREKPRSYHQPPAMNMSIATSLLISRLEGYVSGTLGGNVIDIVVQVGL